MLGNDIPPKLKKIASSRLINLVSTDREIFLAITCNFFVAVSQLIFGKIKKG